MRAVASWRVGYLFITTTPSTEHTTGMAELRHGAGRAGRGRAMRPALGLHGASGLVHGLVASLPSPAHRMIWLSVRLTSSSEMLLSAMLSAMQAPMATMPRHCFSSMRLCERIGSHSATGVSTAKLNAMWPAAVRASRGQ